jgi:arginyl-tRNA synthetase
MGDSVKGMDVIAEAIQEAKTRVDEQKGYSGSEKEEISRKVGLAGLRFLILSHEFHKNINYDPEEFTSFDGFSGPYLLYSLARANSIVRDAGEVAMEAGENILKEEKERRILKYLDIFEEIAIAAAQNNAPHLLCNYLYELAQRFNQFYTEQPILKEGVEEKDKNARVLLTKATAQVLENGLGLLGIETVERM